MSNPASPFVINGNVVAPSGPPLGQLCEGIGFINRPIEQAAAAGTGTAVAAYAGLKINTNRAITIPTGAGWTRITNWDSATYATPLNVTGALVGGTLAIARASAYLANIVLALQFDENNAGREFLLRLFNVTDAVQLGDAVAVFVGRNTGGIVVAFTLPFDGAAGVVGKQVAIEIGNANIAFANVILRNGIWAITGVGT